MQMRIRSYFQGIKLVRMSDGSYCVVRHLGKLKGGLGIRCHETILRLTWDGMASRLAEIVRSVIDPRAGVASPSPG
jgi:hypothetical protein